MAKAKKALQVDSKEKIPDLEKLLKNGVTFVLIYADWCGHCHKYMDNVWNPMCKKGNTKHNVASVREDVLPNTSLANAKIEGYPSVIVVGSDGKPAEFQKPDGEITNAMPNKEQIEKAVNSPIDESIIEVQAKPDNLPPVPLPSTSESSQEGKVYRPTPYPVREQSGGGLLFQTLKKFTSLKTRKTRKHKSKHRKTRRN